MMDRWKNIRRMPEVLTLNATPLALPKEDMRRVWEAEGWLPEEIGVIIDNSGQFFCFEGEDLKLHLQRGMHNITVYSLIGMAANVHASGSDGNHLVALVNGESHKAILHTSASSSSLTHHSGTRRRQCAGRQSMAPFQRLPSPSCHFKRSVIIQYNLEDTFNSRVPTEIQKQSSGHGVEDKLGHVYSILGSVSRVRFFPSQQSC
jgi:hypothetical protein